MRILVAAPYVPYNGILHAGGAYLLHHLDELTRLGNSISLIVPGTPTQLAKIPSAPSWLEVIAGPPVLADRSRVRRWRDAAYRRAMNAPPAPPAESLRSILRAGLVERARTADVLELHWAEYARFASVLRRAGVVTPICVVEHDVDLDAAARRVRDHATGYRRVLGLATAPLVRHLERRGLADADLVAVFKQADEEPIRQAGVRTPVQVIDPWLDEPTGPPPTRRPRTVLFTGALWRRENESGLMWFLEAVWPHVHDAVAGATLQLVGAGASERLRTAAGAAPGVVMVGEVPDLMPYYRSASVFVAPLCVRGGLKFKVPQAMLCELPVLATTVAAEGVTEAAPANALWMVSDDPDEWRVGLVVALTSEAAAAEVGRAAASWCRDFYSFPRSIARLHETYFRLGKEPFATRGRRPNVTGAASKAQRADRQSPT